MIDPAELVELRAFAIDAARAAGRITLEAFGSPQSFDTKPDGSPVTDSDRRAEELLRRRIADRCPRDGILGEEFGRDAGDSGRSWTVDPIDGTVSFVHGVPLYGVLIGLLDGADAVLGVIHLPALDETLAAARGAGCEWVRRGSGPRPARVRNTTRLDRALVLCTDVSRLSGGGLERLTACVGRLRTWGDCYGYLLVATGRAEVMVDEVLAPWDSAALHPIITEAGGVFTDFEGTPGAFGKSGLATNAALSERVRGALK